MRGSCGSVCTDDRSATGCTDEIFKPSREMVPLVISTRRLIDETKVDLPDPLNQVNRYCLVSTMCCVKHSPVLPTIPPLCPPRIFKVMRFKAGVRLEGYFSEIERISSIPVSGQFVGSVTGSAPAATPSRGKSSLYVLSRSIEFICISRSVSDQATYYTFLVNVVARLSAKPPR